MTSSKWLVLAATRAIVPPVAQAQTAVTPPALVTERTLSFSAAHEAAMGALEQCRRSAARRRSARLDAAMAHTPPRR